MFARQRIKIQHLNDVTVATIDIDDVSVMDTDLIAECEATLFDLIDKQNRKKLILDMTKVVHLSSAFLVVLIPLQEKYENAKGKLVLVGVCEDIAQLFHITKLDTMLLFADTEQEALKLLRAKPT